MRIISEVLYNQSAISTWNKNWCVVVGTDSSLLYLESTVHVNALAFGANEVTLELLSIALEETIII